MLIRFVLSPDGIVTPDFSGKLPGRGAWVTSTAEALAAAVKMQAFARSFKTAVSAPEDLVFRVEAGLAKAALSALGLARRSGAVVAGFEKVRGGLKENKLAVLVSASDGAEDGQRKLAGLAKNAAVIGFFTNRELSAALGRENAVHIGVAHGPQAVRFLRAARRVEGFRVH